MGQLDGSEPQPPDFQGQKVLVTGARGFIGTHLCRRLASAGAVVHGVSRTVQRNGSGAAQWWQGDLADLGTSQTLLKAIKPDVIFHLASLVTGSRDLQVVLPTFRDNLVTTLNLLTAAAETGAGRTILAGSLEEPEASGPETFPCSPYAAAKWASNGYARMFHALYRTPVVVAKIFMVYGPGQMDFAKLVPYVILSLLRGTVPKLTSGNRKIDWIYVDDVVNGLLAAAGTRGIEGRTIEIGSGHLYTIREVVQELLAITNSRVVPEYGALSERPLERVRVSNTTATHSLIGSTPAMPLREGLCRTVTWYEAHLADLAADGLRGT